jgi:prophage regulatory protein
MHVVTQPNQRAPTGARRFVRFDRLKPDFGIDYSRMHVNRLEKAGRFPKRVQLGPNSVAWLEDELIAWQTERIAAREAPPEAA